jgi:hypothetical protein
MSGTKISKGTIGGAGLDMPGQSIRTLVVPLAPTTSAAPVASGVRLPADALVLSAHAKISTVTTATSTHTLSAGPSTATIGFLTGLNIATAGIKRGSLASGSVTRGSLLRETLSGAAAIAPAEYVNDTETQIYYSTSVPVTTLKGVLVIEYRKL